MSRRSAERGGGRRLNRPLATGVERVDRMSRVNDLLRDTIAEVVAGELKDPRLDVTLLSVTEVRASRDLRKARALVSVMTETTDEAGAAAKAAIAALNGAAPFVHRTIRRRLRMKRVPFVEFELDPRIAGSAELQVRLRELQPPETMDPAPS
jgi:ribosome-binding factor A